MFEPVPSQRLPNVLAKIASLAPLSAARARATTFSAYDVVLSPDTAPRSLRTQGTRATAAFSRAGAIAPAATTRGGGPPPRPDPIGPGPPVQVIRSRPSGSA